MKKILSLLLMLAMGLSLCACDDTSGGGIKRTEIEKVYDAVESMRIATEATDKQLSKTIGGNKIASIRITITNTQKISDNEYLVSGKITKVDVYGNNWNNTFDCSVESDDGDRWDADNFEYKSNNWIKG